MPSRKNFLEIPGGLSPKIIRLGMLLAIFLYGGFGALDYFALPENREIAWIIRFAIIFPLLILTYILSYFSFFYRKPKTVLLILLSTGLMGILAMIFIAKPNEPAYYSYYAGLILVILWGSFVFQLNFMTSLVLSISTVVLFNFFSIIRISPENLHWGSYQVLALISNNFFLVSSALLASIGANILEKQDKSLLETHEKLKNEKYELEIAKLKAEESDRLKTQFLNNMSHEIRTPMNGIIGFMGLLKSSDIDKKTQEEYINIINQSGERLVNTINDIIEVSKIETGATEIHIKQLNINSLIKTHIKFFKPQADAKNLQLSFISNIPESQAIIASDKTKLNSILINLIKNAIKFTDKGSIKVISKIENNNLKIAVRDTGIGIPEDRLEAVFKRFTQADMELTRKHEGSGLGLSICKSYAEMLGGNIGLESKLNEGSTFTLSLPYKPIENNALNDSDKPLPATAISKKGLILVAEDDEINFAYIKTILQRKNFNILHAENGKESIEILKNHPECNLVLMDLKMPVMSGLDATKIIREFNPDIPIIAQTAHAFTDDKETALGYGCTDFISKPYNKEKLLEIIGKHL